MELQLLVLTGRDQEVTLLLLKLFADRTGLHTDVAEETRDLLFKAGLQDSFTKSNTKRVHFLS